MNGGAMTNLRSIRWKLFAMIVCCVVVPTAFMTIYFPATHIATLEEALSLKALSFARMLAGQNQSAIAFDDAQTAREVLDGVAGDADVVSVTLFRADGTVLQSLGPRPSLVPAWTDTARLTTEAGRMRVVAPVVSQEGPRGLLLLELSTARAVVDGAIVRSRGWYVGIGALLSGVVIAWFVGRSFGRRVGRVKEEAERLAGGASYQTTLSDPSSDEIGQLARAFSAMATRLKEAYASVEQQVLDRTEALRASREQFRALVETTEAVPWELERGTRRFTYIGPQAPSLFGVPGDDWGDAEKWTKHLEPEELRALEEGFAKAAAQQSEQVVEFRFRRGASRPLWIRCLISGQVGTGPEVLRGFMFDVTERAELELELRQAQKLESIGRLASGVAHEINTPVQFVSDSVHFARDSFGEVATLLARYRALKDLALDEAWRERFVELAQAEDEADLPYLIENVPTALERAIEGLGRVATIVRSMKEFAHPDRHQKAEADLNSALASTLVIARNEYKDVADVSTSLGEIPRVVCRLGDLNQAFLNIVVNAAHAIGEVAATRGRGAIHVTTRRDEGDVVIEISDTGGGIPEDIRERIFDPFFTTKGVGRGTGQGLAIARRSIIEGHGGALTFETKSGVGTTFIIRIPISGQAQVAAHAA